MNPACDPYHMNEAVGEDLDRQERHRHWQELCEAVGNAMSRATGFGGGEAENVATNDVHSSADFPIWVEPECPEALIEILEAGARAARDFLRRR